jgi:hypothetical protein
MKLTEIVYRWHLHEAAAAAAATAFMAEGPSSICIERNSSFIS